MVFGAHRLGLLMAKAVEGQVPEGKVESADSERSNAQVRQAALEIFPVDARYGAAEVLERTYSSVDVAAAAAAVDMSESDILGRDMPAVDV